MTEREELAKLAKDAVLQFGMAVADLEPWSEDAHNLYMNALLAIDKAIDIGRQERDAFRAALEGLLRHCDRLCVPFPEMELARAALTQAASTGGKS